MADPAPATFTVGRRSDGYIVIACTPSDPGPIRTATFILPKETAEWLVNELRREIRILSGEDPWASEGT